MIDAPPIVKINGKNVRIKPMVSSHINREGFWREDYEGGNKNLPMPQAAKWPKRKEFLTRLRAIESTLGARDYKGWSTCRCCGQKNGSADFKLTYAGQTWVCPAGFIHYLEDHRVRPSIAFEEFIVAYDTRERSK